MTRRTVTIKVVRNNPGFIFFALLKSFDINYNALGGSAPAARASPGCESAVLPVRNRVEISHTGNTKASQCAHAPMGAGLAQGGYHHYEKRFSAEQNFHVGKMNPSQALITGCQWRQGLRRLPETGGDRPAGLARLLAVLQTNKKIQR